MRPDDAHHDRPTASRGRSALLLILTLACIGAAAAYKLRLESWRIDGQLNTAMFEAGAWLRGTFEITDHPYELARVNGHAFNVVGLFFTLVCAAVRGLTQLAGTPGGHFPAWLYTFVILAPPPLAAFWAFRQVGLSSLSTATFTLALMLGTSLWPVLAQCATGDLYSINHVFAVVGLLFMSGDLLGKRRIWPAGIGLCMAVWSRQMTCLYAPALLWTAWQSPAETVPSAAPTGTDNQRTGLASRQFVHALVWIALAAGLPMALNYAKFGNPLETGYRWMYESRTDPIATAARACFYGPANMPMHFRGMWTSLPLLEIRQGRLMIDATDTPGTAIWFTTPVILGVFVTARRWWADRARRTLMLASFAVMLAVMGYHTTGAQNSGHYRYALDFMPIWLLCISPYLLGPSGRVWTALAFVWSIAYFNLLVR